MIGQTKLELILLAAGIAVIAVAGALAPDAYYILFVGMSAVWGGFVVTPLAKWLVNWLMQDTQGEKHE